MAAMPCSGELKIDFKIAAIVAIFFISDQNNFSYFLSTSHLTLMLPIKFQVNWPFGSGEVKNRFSRWPQGHPSWISEWNDFSYFLIYKSPHPDASYQVSSMGLLVQEKLKTDFQDGHHCIHLGFLNGIIMAIFDLQVTQMLPTKF